MKKSPGCAPDEKNRAQPDQHVIFSNEEIPWLRP
jgi:hypothetical protein